MLIKTSELNKKLKSKKKIKTWICKKKLKTIKI